MAADMLNLNKLSRLQMMIGQLAVAGDGSRCSKLHAVAYASGTACAVEAFTLAAAETACHGLHSGCRAHSCVK
jgi:hypothetical protein